jgi:hypothetical protein
MDEMVMGPLVPMFVVVAAWCGVVFAARRFARKREKGGAWNANGPIHPTEPPADWLRLPGYVARRPTIESEDEEPEDPEDPRVGLYSSEPKHGHQ